MVKIAGATICPLLSLGNRCSFLVETDGAAATFTIVRKYTRGPAEPSRTLDTGKANRARYRDHAGLEIPLNSNIAWPFSRQIANGNAGPTSTLDSMGAKQSFRRHLFNIAPIYKQ